MHVAGLRGRSGWRRWAPLAAAAWLSAATGAERAGGWEIGCRDEAPARSCAMQRFFSTYQYAPVRVEQGPAGLVITPGAQGHPTLPGRIIVDDREPVLFQGPGITGPAAEALAAQMRQGRRALVEYYPEGKSRPVQFEMTLDGFTAAWRRLQQLLREGR